MARIALIPYALDRPLRGIGRYTLELQGALTRQGLDLTLLQSGALDGYPNSVKLSGVNLLPALLTIGQLEIAWITWRRSLDLVHDPTGIIPLQITPAKRL